MKYEILINFPKVMGNGKRNTIILTKKSSKVEDKMY